MKYYNYDIVFQEIPDEVTLAINITNCPHRCVGCHSPQLQQDIGKLLDKSELDKLINNNKDITCICFMGGDADVGELNELLFYLKHNYQSKYKIGWYSGNDRLDHKIFLYILDYIKIGPYNKELGGLSNKKTNQHLYKIRHIEESNILTDITHEIISQV